MNDLDVTDLERRRALVLAILAGGGGPAVIQNMAGGTGAHGGEHLAGAVPLETVRQINKGLGRNFVTRYGTRQGIVVLGKVMPFGVGAGLGAGANGLLATGVIRTTRVAFGPPPSGFAST